MRGLVPKEKRDKRDKFIETDENMIDGADIESTVEVSSSGEAEN